jgi:hypothetical protein
MPMKSCQGRNASLFNGRRRIEFPGGDPFIVIERELDLSQIDIAVEHEILPMRASAHKRPSRPAAATPASTRVIITVVLDGLRVVRLLFAGIPHKQMV